MIIENSLNPNCSETVYRLKKADIDKLPGGMKFINKWMKKCWGGLKPIEEESDLGAYSGLRPVTDDEICIYFYQTSCEGLEIELLKRKIPYMAEKPFTSELETPKENLYEPKD